jgi:hypothetical protein
MSNGRLPDRQSESKARKLVDDVRHMATASRRLNGTFRIILALIVALLAYDPADAQPSLGAVSQAERQVLVRLSIFRCHSRRVRDDDGGMGRSIAEFGSDVQSAGSA